MISRHLAGAAWCSQGGEETSTKGTIFKEALALRAMQVQAGP